MKKTVCLLMLLLVFSACIYSADALLLTNLGSSARMIALGNIEGYSLGANAVFENPASLYRVKNYSVSLFTAKLMDEAVYKNASFAYRTDAGVFAAGFMSVDVSEIPYTQRRYNPDAGQETFFADYYFRFDNSIIKLAYQNELLKNIYFGLSLNYYSNTMDTFKGSGYNSDAGFFIDWEPLKFSVMYKNIIWFSRAEYTSSHDSNYSGQEVYPFQTYFACIYEAGDWNFLAQLKTTSDQVDKLKSMGLHYRPSFIPFFNLYGGYKEYYALRKVVNVHTVGVGLSLAGIDLNYAYEKSDHFDFDNNHYFSVNMNF